MTLFELSLTVSKLGARPVPTIVTPTLAVPSETEIVPLTPVVSVGLYWTVTVQVPAGASAPVQVFAVIAT